MEGWLLGRQLYLNYQLTIDPAKKLIGCERVKFFPSSCGKTEGLARSSPFLRCREIGIKLGFLFVCLIGDAKN